MSFLFKLLIDLHFRTNLSSSFKTDKGISLVFRGFFLGHFLRGYNLQLFYGYLPTAREGNVGNVFTGVCHSLHNWPHSYLFTAHLCYSAVGTHPSEMLSCYL